MTAFWATVVIVAVVLIFFRQQTLQALGFVGAMFLDAFGLGVLGGSIAALTVAGLSMVLTIASLPFLVYGILAHVVWAVFASLGIRLVMYAIWAVFVGVLLLYFRTLFTAGRAAVNFATRVMWRTLTNLGLMEGAAPELAEIAPNAERHARIALLYTALVDVLASIGLALLPEADGVRWLAAIGALALAFVIMVALWNYRTGFGRRLLAKIVLGLLVIAAVNFGERAYLRYRGDADHAHKIAVCRANPLRCWDAAVWKKRHESLYAAQIQDAAQTLRRRHERRLDGLVTRWRQQNIAAKSTKTNSIQYWEYVNLRNAEIAQYRQNVRLLWSVPTPRKLTRYEHDEWVAAFAHNGWVSFITLVGLVIVLFARLEQPAAEKPKTKPGFWRWVFRIAGVAALLVVAILLIRHFFFRPKAAPIVATAPSAVAQPIGTTIPVAPVPPIPPSAITESVPAGLCPEVYEPAWTGVSLGRRRAWCHAQTARQIIAEARSRDPLPTDTPTAPAN